MQVIQAYGGNEKKVLVAYQQKFVANCNLDEMVSLPCMLSGTHNLEEADQLVLLNCVDVAKGSNTKQHLTVYASDIDILVILISFYCLIPMNTTMLRRSGQVVSIGDFYHRLGEKRAKALMGWYTFQGNVFINSRCVRVHRFEDNFRKFLETDKTGGFSGKGITSHFKAFIAADDAILRAFSRFGETISIPKYIQEQSERYICYLYGQSYSKNICGNTFRVIHYRKFVFELNNVSFEQICDMHWYCRKVKKERTFHRR